MIKIPNSGIKSLHITFPGEACGVCQVLDHLNSGISLPPASSLLCMFRLRFGLGSLTEEELVVWQGKDTFLRPFHGRRGAWV